MKNWRLSLAGLIMAVLIMSGCGPTLGQSFKKVEIVPINKALIYIYRPMGFLGWARTIDVLAGDKDVINLSNSSYYPYFANPGEIEFKSKLGSARSESLTLDAKPNRTYFLKTGIRKGSTAVQIILTIMPPEEGETEIGECRLVLDEQP